MRKVLPTFYYLDHFAEFLQFLTQYNAHLLRPQDIEFIAVFRAQPKNVQCVLVRSLNRKYPFLAHHTFVYDEISDPEDAIIECHRLGWFTLIPQSKYRTWLAQLTKAELFGLCDELALPAPAKSVAKPHILEWVEARVEYAQVRETALLQSYSYRLVDEVIEYGLFLFFGHLSGRLNQFSMRDLGIMRTRKQVAEGARYQHLEDAQAHYYWSVALRDVKRANKHNLPLPAPVVDIETHNGVGLELRDIYWFIYGKRFFATEPKLAVQYWRKSQHSDAIAKRLRYEYQHGDKDQVIAECEALIEDPPNEVVLFFAMDFLARKTKQKRTSMLTDWLRSSSDLITLDEIHRNRVEYACVEVYQQRGIEAYRMENEPWRALFGLVFWPILFDPNNPVGNEFDHRPYHLIHNNLYTERADGVEAELAKLQDPGKAERLLLQRATQYYGQSNGIFRWHKVIHQRMVCFFKYLKTEQITSMLRAMAQNYAMYCDGFPDIAIVENGQFIFKEIKAQGDVLRKNQLVTLAKMRELGIAVDITRVEWGVDPDQIYVVVDIETTGGRAGNHRITEIGAVKLQHGNVIDEWQSLLNPERMIPKNITALTGIDQSMVAHAPRFADIADSLRKFMDGTIFVAHNVNFDYGFIKAEYERLGERFSMPKLCTVQQMRRTYPKLPSYSLANLTKHFGISMTRHHRAMSDAVAASELLNIINQARKEN